MPSNHPRKVPRRKRSSTSQRKSDIEARFLQGFTAHQQNDLQSARECYRKVLDLAPNHAQSLHFLGLIEFRHFDKTEGLQLLCRSAEMEPGNADFCVNLGSAYEELNQYERAIDVFEQALTIAPAHETASQNLADALNDYGLALMERREFDLAERQFRKAFARDSSDFVAALNLGIVLHKLERRDQAIEQLRAALALQPCNAQAWFNLGFVYQVQGELEPAMEAFEKAVDHDPSDGRYRELLIRALISRGDSAAALEAIRKWQSREPDNAVAAHMAAAITETDLPDRASDQYVKTIFDQFSDSYELVLDKINYRGPALIQNMLSQFYGPADKLVVLDAGCGTGLCGPVVRPLAKTLIGVDLSQGMLSQAEKTGGYDELIQSELVEFLTTSPDRFDLIISGDTFNYFGNLQKLISAADGALCAEGRLLFTLEVHDNQQQDFQLNAHGRYSHREGYVEWCIEEARLELTRLEHCVLRTESDKPVHGIVVAVQKH